MMLRFWHDNKGVAALEAALMFPFLALTCFATMDASFLMLQNHKMESSLSAAGNYLARSRTPQNFETQAKRLATTGQIKNGGTPLLNGWAASDITVSYKKVANTPTQNGMSYRGGATIDVIQLSSEFDYEGLGLINNIMGGSLKVSASYEERLVGDAP